MVAAERQHGHGVAAHHADRAGRGGGRFGSHDRAYEHAVAPVAGLIHERGRLRAAAAEDDGGNRHALPLVKLGADARAVLGRRGEAAVGMRTLFLGCGAVPGLALPVQRMLRRILVQALPPDGLVVQILRNVRENRALAGRSQRVGVGFGVGAGRDAEEAVFGVDRVQPAVLAGAHPRDVVAHRPYPIALPAVGFRRDQHGQVGLAACGRERRGHIGDFALRVLDPEDQHMFRHPALGLAEVGGDAQRKALFAEQHVPAVAGVDGDDGVVLREVADVPFFGVDVALAVQPAHPLRVVAQGVPHGLADARHDRHVEHDVNRVGQLDAYFGKRRADRAHGIGNDIHGAAPVAAPRDVVQHFVGLLRFHPVVGRAGILFFSGADEGSVLHARHVVDSGAVQIAARQLFLIQFDQLARGAGLGAQLLPLSFGPVDPNDLIGADKLFHLFDPVQYRSVVCHSCSPSGLMAIIQYFYYNPSDFRNQLPNC